MRDGDGRIHIVTEGFLHLVPDGGHGGSFLTGNAAKGLPGIHEAPVALLRSLEGLVGEVKGAAVVGLEDEEADGHGAVGLVQELVTAGEELRKRDEVPQRLAHLLAAYGDHVVVNPIVNALRTA